MAITWRFAGTTVRRRYASLGRPALVVSAVLAGVLTLLAIIGPWIAPYDPAATDVLAAGQGSSGGHLLGTDSLGRDILSRALAGARLSFAGPAVIVLISSTLGTTLALFAAWHGGWVDRTVNRFLNVLFSVPGILVAVLASAVFGAGFWAPVLALGVVYTPYMARVVRSVAVRERRRGYVESLQLAGLSSWRISLRHLVPNVLPMVVAQSTYGLGSALADFAAISFIGLGIQPPAAEWGVMVSDGRSELLDGAVQQSLVAGSLIVVTVVAFNVLGAQLSSRSGGRP
ncbi:peptide/nickel transport system permease protein [Amycolatopsis tolypomycina]|uniref:Peptide/nickel transport system permease protein n=1 Tax=Amycolatopsis tolypomycina TaxID=208445 RepID=A0A1H4ZAX1_9PSEU|nr:ABC transporter permease [Amycolatopsis tolypomycina]SED27087.1 peptide/nickel transport system permease protein [Amycolatopsis tolypomycina]